MLKPNRKWSTKYKNRLPDSAFLLPKHRKLPYKNANGTVSLSHVRNALARASQVEGVSKREIDMAIRKGEKVLREHGGYESNPFFKSPPNPRDSEEYKREYSRRFEHYIEDMSATDAHREADSDAWDATKGKKLTYQKNRGLRPNFLFGGGETEEERKFREMRKSRVWKDKFRYFNVSEGMKRAEAEKAADLAYEEYWARKRATEGKDVAFKRNPRRNSSSVELYANPYDTSITGFYFSSFDEFQKKYNAQYKKTRTEEYEIDFINGSDLEQAAFQSMEVSQANIEEFFDVSERLADMEDYEIAAVLFLMEDRSMEPEEAIDKAEDVSMQEGTLEDAAYEFFEQMGEIDSKNAEMYFDYDGFGRDLEISGDDIQSTVEEIEDLKESDDEDDQEQAESLQAWVDEIESKSAEDRAYEFIDSIGGLDQALSPEALARYFDYAAFGRDADINGDWTTFSHGGTDYVVTNAAEF